MIKSTCQSNKTKILKKIEYVGEREWWGEGKLFYIFNSI